MKKSLLYLVYAQALFSANYLTPPEWDNVVISQKSDSYALIDNTSSGIWSGNRYMIGGKYLNYKCVRVPKIQCVGSSPKLVATVSEVGLKNSGYTVPVWVSNIRVEEDATNWYVCGAAYGGVTADRSVMSSTTSGGNQKINYNYQANYYVDAFYGFTKPSAGTSRGDTSSFMFIKHKQVCR